MSAQISLLIQAVDEATEVVRKVSRETSGALDEVKQASENVARAHKISWGETKNLVTAFSGLATSAFSLYQSIDRVQDAQVNLSRANLLVQQATNAVEDAQRRYNAVVEKYSVDSEQAQAALKDLQLAQERYNYAVERANLVQSNYNELVVQTAITFIPGLITAINSGIDAFKLAQNSIGAVSTALNFLAANPIVLVIAAIAALVSGLIYLYNMNEDFRNAVNRLGATLMDFFKPIIDTIINALTWLWRNVITPVAEAFRKFFDIITNNPILAALFGPLTTIIYLIRNWEDVTKSLQSAWDAFCSFLYWSYDTFIKPIVDALAWFYNNVVKPVAEFFGRAFAGGGAAAAPTGGYGYIPPEAQEAMRRAGVPGMQAGGIVTKPTLALLGEAGPEAVIPLERLQPSVSIEINAPLVNVEGSADRRTAEYAAELVREKLKTVMIEATSRSAPTKRVAMPKVT